MIHHGDCLDVMAGMEPESIDAIVTDPPYGLEFMGKEWDRLGDHGQVKHAGPSQRSESGDPYARARVSYYGSANRKCRTCGHWEWSGTPCKCERPDFPTREGRQGALMQEWHARWAEAAYRVAKPSAYLLAFGGTRTVHRMTVALEDAGWIIRDMLVWGYASGFPKSKASLKPAWEPIVMARKPGPLRMLNIDECRIGVRDESKMYVQPRPTTDREGASWSKGEHVPFHYGESGGRWPANVILTDPIFDGGWEGVVGGGEASVSPSDITTPNRTTDREGWSGLPYNERVFGYGDSGTYSRFFIIPKADRADREPVDPSYSYRLHRERGECSKLSAWDSADQRLADRMDSTSPARATSEATSADDSSSDTSQHGSPSTDPSPTDTKSTTSTATSRTTGSRTSSSSVPLPTSASTRAASSETASGGSPAPYVESSSLWGSPTGISVVRGGRSTDDAGPVISPSSSSRNACVVCGRPLPRFSTHPTQKPTDLMRHLVRLVTPTGGTVLDPFLGSGTTALAAEMEGFEWVGIEREAEYVAIAEARLKGTQRGLGLGA